MAQIGSLLFLLLAPMAAGAMLLLASAGRMDRESLSVPILAVFLVTGLAVSLLPLQSFTAHRGLILGLYLGTLIVAFLASLFCLRGFKSEVLRGLLLVSGALSFMALVLQAVEGLWAHSVNIGRGRLALDYALSAMLLGGLLTAVLVRWMRQERGPLLKTAATWILIPAAMKTGLSGHYLGELIRLDLLQSGLSGWPGLLLWIREGSLLGLLIGAAVVWYSARGRPERSVTAPLHWTVAAGLVAEAAGRLLLTGRGLLL
jgi:hypothetical protein